MSKLKLPFLSPKAFTQLAKSLIDHTRPSVKKVGAPPGTLTYTGHYTVPTEIKHFQFNKDEIFIDQPDTPESLKAGLSEKHINWVDVVGFEDIELMRTIGSMFDIDQLTLEDILNISQLPKIETHAGYLYITLKLVDLVPEEQTIHFTHYNLVLTRKALITFSEKPNAIFNGIKKRLENGSGNLRNSTIDYLSYRIIDTIVDNYYFTLDWFTNVLADLETELVETPSKKHIQTILAFKKHWLVLRKAIFPFQEAVRRMVRTEHQYTRAAGKHYIDDLQDHLQSIGQTMEILREALNSLMDLYNSTVGNKMNEVMQILTIIATIFIPLTFIAGIYGMNFKNMPELSWENGYFYALALMLAVGIIMYIYLKRKRWL